MTHIPRPHRSAHACLRTVRDTQERRLVRSRYRSRPGQSREAGSRPGPSYEEHRSKTLHSARLKQRGRTPTFYRMGRGASIFASDPTPRMLSEWRPQLLESLPHTPSPVNPGGDKPVLRGQLPAPLRPPKTGAGPIQHRLRLLAVPSRPTTSSRPAPAPTTPPPRLPMLRPVRPVSVIAFQFQ